MPSYVLHPSQASPSAYHRGRTHSLSHHQAPQIVYTSSHGSHGSHTRGRSSSRPAIPAYTQTAGYTYASPQYSSRTHGGHYDTSRGHHRGGSGGVVYTQDYIRRSPTHNGGYHHSSPSSHSHRSRSHYRSHSVPRQPVQIIDASHRHHRNESHGRHTHSRRGSSSTREPIADRIRRMFGFGGHSSSYHPSHSAEYRDMRSGRTVDWRGRPIYRV